MLIGARGSPAPLFLQVLMSNIIKFAEITDCVEHLKWVYYI